jgi:hypothetical protein
MQKTQDTNHNPTTDDIFKIKERPTHSVAHQSNKIQQLQSQDAEVSGTIRTCAVQFICSRLYATRNEKENSSSDDNYNLQISNSGKITVPESSKHLFDTVSEVSDDASDSVVHTLSDLPFGYQSTESEKLFVKVGGTNEYACIRLVAVPYFRLTSDELINPIYFQDHTSNEIEYLTENPPEEKNILFELTKTDRINLKRPPTKYLWKLGDWFRNLPDVQVVGTGVALLIGTLFLSTNGFGLSPLPDGFSILGLLISSTLLFGILISSLLRESVLYGEQFLTESSFTEKPNLISLENLDTEYELDGYTQSRPKENFDSRLKTVQISSEDTVTLSEVNSDNSWRLPQNESGVLSEEATEFLTTLGYEHIDSQVTLYYTQSKPPDSRVFVNCGREYFYLDN